MGFRMAAFCLLPMAMAAPAQAQEFTDGAYGCWISGFFLGDIEIADGRYRGPGFDGRFEDGWYPVEITPPTLQWGGPLGGITASGPVVSTVMTDAGGNRTGFDIMIQNRGSGNFQTISCSPSS